MYEFSSINKYRRFLFGIATIWIAWFHSYMLDFSKLEALSFMNIGAFFEVLKRLGNIGVDIFLLLSGIGLYFSFSKNSNIIQFYKKRMIRVLPCSIILVLIVTYLSHVETWKLFFIRVTFLNFLFFKDDDQTFWYIPAILLLYLLFPVFYYVIQKFKVPGALGLIAISCIIAAIAFFVNYDMFFYQWEMLLTRIPVFIAGILLAPVIKNEKKISNEKALILCLIGLVYTIVIHIIDLFITARFVFLWHYLYFPLAVFLVFFFSYIRSHVSLSFIVMPIEFVGDFSLEMNLIHQSLYYFLLGKISFFDNHQFIYASVIILISILLSFILKTLISLIFKLFKSEKGSEKKAAV